MSVEARLEVADVEELKTKLEKLDASLKREINEKLAEIGKIIEEKARQFAPIRTGRLRASIYSQVSDWTLTIGAKALYARYIEFGTRWIRPRQFLQRAVDENLAKIENGMRQAFFRLFRRLNHEFSGNFHNN